MKKLLALTLAPLLLASCNGGGFGSGKVDIGVSTSDAGSYGTVIRTITTEKRDKDGNVTAPASVSLNTKKEGNATFVFTARPGADAAYITGYRITRYTINGQDALNGETPEEHKSNLYVTSGYDCEERRADYSCPSSSTTLVPANGLPSAEFQLDFVSTLLNVAASTRANAYSSVDLEFIGKTSNQATIVIPVKGVNASVTYSELYN